MSDDAKVVEHIEQVRQSLYTAKESFASNKGVRGELDLMLAEAEMKHLRETKGWRSYINRQTMIFTFAFIIALTGFTGWYWAKSSESTLNNSNIEIMNKTDAIATVDAKPKTIVINNDFSKSAKKMKAAPTNTLPEIIEAVQPKRVVASKSKVLISDSELYGLIRTARNKLEE